MDNLHFWRDRLLTALARRGVRKHVRELLLATHKDPHVDGEAWEALRDWLSKEDG